MLFLYITRKKYGKFLPVVLTLPVFKPNLRKKRYFRRINKKRVNLQKK